MLALLFVFMWSVTIQETPQAQTDPDSSRNAVHSKLDVHLGGNGTMLGNWTGGGNSFVGANTSVSYAYSRTKGPRTLQFNASHLFGVQKEKGNILKKNVDLLTIDLRHLNRIRGNWHVITMAYGYTQLLDGFIYLNAANQTKDQRYLVASFLAPGFFHEAVGMLYMTDDFDLYVGFGPLAMKQTLMLSDRVDKSIYGMEGTSVRNKAGALARGGIFESFFGRKLLFGSELLLFSGYAELSDVNMVWNSSLKYALSPRFSLNSTLNCIYDSDTSTPTFADTNGDGIPETLVQGSTKLQTKATFSVGLSLSF